LDCAADVSLTRAGGLADFLSAGIDAVKKNKGSNYAEIIEWRCAGGCACGAGVYLI
jgi:hypothetical protein